MSWYPKDLGKLASMLENKEVILATGRQHHSPGTAVTGQAEGALHPDNSINENSITSSKNVNSDGTTLNFLFNPLKALDALHETIRKADDFLAPRLKKLLSESFCTKLKE